jgi:hypothetical protein
MPPISKKSKQLQNDSEATDKTEPEDFKSKLVPSQFVTEGLNPGGNELQRTAAGGCPGS